MISDIIVTWPKNNDYPLWRQFVRDNRTKFNEIIIGFHNTNTGVDYSEFVKAAMHPDYVHTFNAPEPHDGIGDWRDLSVNAGLLHSYNADWILFTEQDFFPGDGFWDEVQKHEDAGCEVIAAYQADRMHPCCIFIKRKALDRTNKKFGIVPGKGDHFYQLQKDIENAGMVVGKINPETYYHYNGLSQNWYLATIGQKPNYHLPEFIEYLTKSVQVTVPHHDGFDRIAYTIITAYKAENDPKDHSPATPPA